MERGLSLDRSAPPVVENADGNDEESGPSASTVRASPPVQNDKAFWEGEAQKVEGLEGLAGITGKQPVKLDLYRKLTTEGAREKLIEFCASDKVQVVVLLYIGSNSLGDLDAAALTALFTPLANLINLKTLSLYNNSLGKNLDAAPAKAFATALAQLRSLTFVNLDYNSLSEPSLFILFNIIRQHNPHREQVTIQFNDKVLSPFLYPTALKQHWQISIHLPRFRHFFTSLLFREGKVLFIARWFVVLSHCIVILLAYLLRSGNNNDDDDDDDDDDDSPNIIRFGLERVCGDLPQSQSSAYVDAVSSYVAVIIAAAIYVAFLRLHDAAKEIIAEKKGSHCGWLLRKLLCSLETQAEKKKDDDAGDDEGQTKQTTHLGIDAPAKKSDRALFFFLHSMIITFVIFSGPSWASGETVLCIVSNSLASVFLKPMIVSMFYCLNYLLDSDGWMLFHNPLTDSMVFVACFYLAMYVLVAVVFALPAAVSFGYFFLAPAIVVVCYGLAFGRKSERLLFTAEFEEDEDGNQFGMKDERTGAWRDGWTPEEKALATGAQMLLKRILAYTFFASCAFSISFFTLYEGGSYGEILEEAARAALPAFRIWSPEVSLDFFSWPEGLSLPNQIALALSLSVLSLEYLPLAWGVVMERLFPQGYATGWE